MPALDEGEDVVSDPEFSAGREGSSVELSPERGTLVTILAVDDHSPFRAALRDLIEAASGFVLIGQASSGEEAVVAVDRLSPQLVIMDVLMPGMGGIAAARAITRKHPGVVVMLVSVDDPAGYPGASELGDGVTCARKQDLRPYQLRRAWETLRH